MAVGFASNIVPFASQYGITHCHDAPLTIQGVMKKTPEPVSEVEEIFEPKLRPLRPLRVNIVMLNGASFCRTV